MRKDRVKSATSDERPDFLRMIDDIRNRIQVDLVLIHKFDRFAKADMIPLYTDVRSNVPVRVL